MPAITTEKQVTIKLTEAQIQLVLCYLEIERDRLMIGEYQLCQDKRDTQRAGDLTKILHAFNSAL